MLIVFCQNPGEESGGANVWSCFVQFLFRLMYIFVILFMRLDARLRRGGAVLYLSFNKYFRCPPICPLAVHRVCLVHISTALHLMDAIGG